MDSELDDSVEILTEYLKHQRLLVDYVQVAGVSLLVYDYLLQLPNEIRFVWIPGHWSYTNVLFLLVRYLPIIDVGFILHNQIAINASPHACKWTYPVWFVTNHLIVVLAELILVIRTWAVWQLDLRVLCGLGLMWLALLIVSCVIVVGFIKALIVHPLPYVGFRGCLTTSSYDEKNAVDLPMALVMVLETAILALICISAYLSHKRKTRNRFLDVIYRDGIMFYFSIEVAIIVKMISVINPNNVFHLVVSSLMNIIYSVIITRMIINIRKAGRQNTLGDSVGLHHNTQPIDTVLLEFRSTGSYCREDSTDRDSA